MEYDMEKSVITGLFHINHSYKGVTIKASFQVEIRLVSMQNRNQYPVVINTDSKIKRIAKLKNLPCVDLHVYTDNRLCLGLPERFFDYYPSGFELELFFTHLIEHLYWVAYFERYDKAPWEAEAHGDAALAEYYIERKDIENLRKVYKKILGKGIALSKLKRYLNSQERTKSLLKELGL